MSVKIRGIYSSALTQLLLKNKIKVSSPSENVKDSFKKAKFDEDYDTIIHDLADKNGIVIKGEESEKVTKVIMDDVEHVAVKKEESGHIYLGKIIKLDPNTKNIHVDLGLKKIGLLPLKDYWGYVKEGEKILVQLKEEDPECYTLSTKIHIFGPDTVLIQKGFTKLSSNIRDREESVRLNKITDEKCKEGWGILWKSSAQDKKDDELKKEIDDLYKDYDKIKEKFEKEEGPKLIRKGLITVYMRFDKTAKETLDALRREVKPTVENHHTYKTDNFHNVVDFSENLIKAGFNEKKLNKEIESFVLSKAPKEGDLYLAAEYRLDGTTNFLKGRIEKRDENKIVLKRFMKSGSKYNGLDIIFDRGDYALTELKKDAWYTKHSFYSEDNKLKGEVYIINTPVELQTEKAATINLELAVVKKDGKGELINEDVLKKYADEGEITSKLLKEAKVAAKKIGDDKK
ncbi:RNA-binding protein AU-1 [Candidatus Tiddalikarchaeum anstoanum]|nr:RNA-binding protein AU-1 [Candidatus Tiddalikarchaeum anstoanum]